MGDTLAPGTVLRGRYVIESPIQVGRFGALYRGSDTLGAARVVLIREHADPSPEAQARFWEEAALLAGLDHPSLPVVLDSFVEPSGRQYLVVLGYVEPHLGLVLAQKGALAEGEALVWFGRLLGAVAHLHAQQPPILHGHISPGRIVLTADGTPHLMGLIDVEDTGDAGAAQEEMPFLAPEQREGRADERSDVYGLGATLYALLTGSAPPDARARAAGAALKPPREAVKAISPQVEAVILQAMALDPDERFAGPGQMLQALERGAALSVWHGAAAPDRIPHSPSWHVLALAGVSVAALLAAGALLWHSTQRREGASAAPLPSPAATVTAAAPRPAEAVATPQPTATPEQQATATASPAPTVTSTTAPDVPAPPTSAPTARWFAGPPATSTPRWFPPPSLVYPAEGASFTGGVEFRWSWPYTLADDEYFDLQVYRVGMQPKGIAWCKQPYYRTTGLLLGEGQYFWRVQVIRGTGGQVQGLVSDPSSARLFAWSASPAGH